MLKGSFAAILFGLTSLAMATDSVQFRGPDRNGIYPETGLMRQWPERGPVELWSLDGLGQGYGSMSIVNGSLYVTGVKSGNEYVYAVSLSGEKKWEQSMGKAHSGSGYPGSRSTPTYDQGALYVMNSVGKIFRLNAETGKIDWELDMSKRFENVRSPHFGFAESLLIDGDRVICTPGGKGATVAALDKKTGKTVWTTPGLDEATSYCSIRVFDNGKVRQYITMTSKSMIGVDPKDGALLWRHDYPAQYDIHAVSPVFSGNLIYVSDGYKQGGTMVELAADGKSVAPKWTEKSLDCHHGGLVEIGGYIYGAASNGRWVCLDINTGEVKKAIKGVGKGSVIYADGMLIGYGEKGKMGLFKASPDQFDLISEFEIEKGKGQHWSHPVISAGKLYVRRGNVLMAYEIQSKNS